MTSSRAKPCLVLGVVLGHGTSAAVLDGHAHVLAAVEADRITRHKKERRFPLEAICEVLRSAGVSGEQLSAVAYSTYQSDSVSVVSDRFLSGRRCRAANVEDALREELASIGLGQDVPVWRAEHHQCHAYAALQFCGKPDPLVVTADGYGDGICGTMSQLVDGRLHRIAERTLGWDASVALVYQALTGALGFQMLSEEFKLLGLEAQGDVSRGQALLAGLFSGEDPRSPWNHARLAPWSWAGQQLRGLYTYFDASAGRFAPPDVAAACQRLVEKRIISWLEAHHRERTWTGDVAAAGGTFLNVKLNRMVTELPWVDSLFVFPAAGDSGNAVGAAVCWLRETGHYTGSTHTLREVFWGPRYPCDEIDRQLASFGLSMGPRIGAAVTSLIAEAVADGRLVAWYRGRSEFGPRALLHRSLLLRPDDPKLIERLNKSLRRDAFMPFAAALRAERRTKSFLDFEGSEACLPFMVTTALVSEEFRARHPCVCHPVHVAGRPVGFSSRPQVVYSEVDPEGGKLLAEFERMSGLWAILNTSFNLHGEPIVESPLDALRTFASIRWPGSLLVLEDRVIAYDENVEALSGLRHPAPVVLPGRPRRRLEGALCVVKPDGVAIGLAEQLKTRWRTLGLAIEGETERQLSREEVAAIFPVIRDEEYEEYLDYLSGGTIRAFRVRGPYAERLLGECKKSVRARLHAHPWRNLVHSADNGLEYCHELQALFPHLQPRDAGLFADLHLRVDHVPDVGPEALVAALGERTSMALAGFVLAGPPTDDLLEYLLRLERASVASGLAMIFGYILAVREGPEEMRMLAFFPEGVRSVGARKGSRGAAVSPEELRALRQEEGALLVYSPLARDVEKWQRQLALARSCGAEGVEVVNAGTTLEHSRAQLALARQDGLAEFGGSEVAFDRRPFVQGVGLGVSRGGLDGVLGRFPGLSI